MEGDYEDIAAFGLRVAVLTKLVTDQTKHNQTNLSFVFWFKTVFIEGAIHGGQQPHRLDDAAAAAVWPARSAVELFVELPQRAVTGRPEPVAIACWHTSRPLRPE